MYVFSSYLKKLIKFVFLCCTIQTYFASCPDLIFAKAFENTTQVSEEKTFRIEEKDFIEDLERAQTLKRMLSQWLESNRMLEENLDRIQTFQFWIQAFELQTLNGSSVRNYPWSGFKEVIQLPNTLQVYFEKNLESLTSRERLNHLKKLQKVSLEQQGDLFEKIENIQTNCKKLMLLVKKKSSKKTEYNILNNLRKNLISVLSKEYELLKQLTQELSDSVKLFYAQQRTCMPPTEIHFQLKKKEGVEDLKNFFEKISQGIAIKDLREDDSTQLNSIKATRRLLDESLAELNDIQQELKYFSKKTAQLSIINLFGLPGASPVRWSFFQQSLNKAQLWAKECANPSNWNYFQWIDLISILTVPVIVATLIFTVRLLLRPMRADFSNREQASLGKVTKDRLDLSLERIIWNVIESTPMPLLGWSLRWGLNNSNFIVLNSFGEALKPVLIPLFVMQIGLLSLSPKGLFVEHFRCSKAVAIQVTKILKPRVSLGLIALFFLHLWGSSPDYVATLGRCCLLFLAALIFETCHAFYRSKIRLYWEASPFENKVPISPSIWIALMIVSGWMAERALCGYLQNAQLILQYFSLLLSLWGMTLLLYQFCFRWLFLNRRRHTFEQAKHRRQEAEALKARQEEAPFKQELQIIEIEEPMLDLETASSAVLKLCKSTLLTAFLAFSMRLLSYPHGSLGLLNKPFPVPLPWLNPTLYGGLAAFVIAVITFNLNQQIGSLLDVSLLARSKLSVDAADSIKRILRYSIIGIGAFWSTSMLQWEWSNWSFAAIASFLGFGIRDIFASFFAGLIIMITQPLKVGQHVAFGEFSGVVKRITSLSTVLLDSKQREHFIPNKDVLVERWFHDVNSEVSFPTTLHIGLAGQLPPETVLNALSALLTAWANEFSLQNLNYQLHSISKEAQTYELMFVLENSETLSQVKADLYQRLSKLFKNSGVSLTEAI